jgi:hypothetical protein
MCKDSPVPNARGDNLIDTLVDMLIYARKVKHLLNSKFIQRVLSPLEKCTQ